MLKELGITYDLQEQDPSEEPIKPRIIIRPARPGHQHALGKAELRQLLDFVGVEAIYGLRSIELTQRPAGTAAGLPPYGRLIVPGRIKLFEMPVPPWRLPGILPDDAADSMRRAGGEVELNHEIGASIVRWPGDSLRTFMTFEVFLHEIGHHILQHHKGKRKERIARTKDHEAFAKRFAERCRATWFSEEPDE